MLQATRIMVTKSTSLVPGEDMLWDIQWTPGVDKMNGLEAYDAIVEAARSSWSGDRVSH